MLASSQLLFEDIYFCNCCIYQGGLAKSVDFSSLAQAVRNYFSNALPWTKCIYFSTSALTSKQWATEGCIYSQTFSGVPIHSSLLYIGFLFGETKGKEKGTSPPNGFWLPVNGGNSTRRYKAQEDVFREVINLLGWSQGVPTSVEREELVEERDGEMELSFVLSGHHLYGSLNIQTKSSAQQISAPKGWVLPL